MYKYDYLVVGAGLFGSVFASEVSKKGSSCLIVDKRDHVGGNCYTERIEGINVHRYGAHIFRTSDKDIWQYMTQFCEFNNFINSPIANYHGEIYNLPFNMNTFSKMWSIVTPKDAKEIIARQSMISKDEPDNLENHVISMVGTDIYNKLVKGYTEKQWGKPCKDLPKSIIRRLPVRFIYDNNYYNDAFQGIPKGGYTRIFDQLLASCEVRLRTDYNDNRTELNDLAKSIVYTGPIDEYYDYCFGPLEYRSLRFEHEIHAYDNYQGVAVVNYTDSETPYTRSIEHKHFEFGAQENTVVSWEYPETWSPEMEPYYPMEDEANAQRYTHYKKLSDDQENLHFGGRLGEYRYYDMQDTIRSALQLARRIDQKI